MPPKAGRSPAGATTTAAADKEDNDQNPLQAVLITDPFDASFSNWTETANGPRCLIPLLGVPLIEYSLDLLARSGVREVFVYVTSWADEIEGFLRGSRWWGSGSGGGDGDGDGGGGFGGGGDDGRRRKKKEEGGAGEGPFARLVLVRLLGAGSVGDVMRDLDRKGVMRGGDFVCVTGCDVVGDFELGEVLRSHRRRRARSREGIMTVVLREVGPHAPAGDGGGGDGTDAGEGGRATFVIDPLRERCLHYEAPPLPATKTRQRRRKAPSSSSTWAASLDPDLLSHPEIDIRQDLEDLQVDICTPDVLGLWSDNFDNQSLRGDFLHGILKDYELNGKTVHTHVLKRGYAARVADEAAYARIALDIRNGWCKPFSFDVAHEASEEEEEKSSTIPAAAARKTGLSSRTTDEDNDDEDDEEDGAAAEFPLSRTASVSSLSTDASSSPADSDVLSRNLTRDSDSNAADTPSHSRQHSVTAPSLNLTTTTSSQQNDAGGHSGGSASSSQFHHEALSTLTHRFGSAADPSDIQVELMGLRFATNASEGQVRRAVATGVARYLLATAYASSSSSSSSSSADASGGASGGSGAGAAGNLSALVSAFLSRYRGLIRRENEAEDPPAQAEWLAALERALVSASAHPGSIARQRRQHHRSESGSGSGSGSGSAAAAGEGARGVQEEGGGGVGGRGGRMMPTEAELLGLAGKVLLFTCKALYDLDVVGEEAVLRWWGDEEEEDGDGDDCEKYNADQEEEEEDEEEEVGGDDGDADEKKKGKGVEKSGANEKTTTKKIREQTGQFVRWLREAESESDEEEEDNDDDDE